MNASDSRRMARCKVTGAKGLDRLPFFYPLNVATVRKPPVRLMDYGNLIDEDVE
jgi:hypothetical protein